MPDPDLIRELFDGAEAPGAAPPELGESALDQLRDIAANAKNENARVAALRVLIEHEPKTPQHALDAVTELAAEVAAMSDEKLEADLAILVAADSYTREELDCVTRSRARNETLRKTRQWRRELREKRDHMERLAVEKANRMLGRRSLGDGAEVVDGEVVDEDGSRRRRKAPPGIAEDDPSVRRPERRQGYLTIGSGL